MSVKDFSYGYLSSVIYGGFATKLEMGAVYYDRFENKWEVIALLDDNSGIGHNGSGFYGAAFAERNQDTNSLTGNIVISIRGTDNPYDMAGMAWNKPETWDDFVPFVEDAIFSDYFGVVRGRENIQLPVALEFVNQILSSQSTIGGKWNEISFTGQSLGGYIGSLLAVHYQGTPEASKHGLMAVTFNAPGVADPSRYTGNYNSIIVNYVISSDIIGNTGIHLGETYIFKKVFPVGTGSLTINSLDHFFSYIEKMLFERHDVKNIMFPDGIKDYKDLRYSSYFFTSAGTRDGNLVRSHADKMNSNMKEVMSYYSEHFLRNVMSNGLFAHVPAMEQVIETFAYMFKGLLQQSKMTRNIAPLFIEGGEGSENLIGTYDNNVMLAGSGHDQLRGYSGNDILFGESGKDVLFGGTYLAPK